jgi:hypothetical protein
MRKPAHVMRTPNCAAGVARGRLSRETTMFKKILVANRGVRAAGAGVRSYAQACACDAHTKLRGGRSPRAIEPRNHHV